MSTISSIGFLGAGKMATALAKGFLKAGLIEPGSLIASDVFEAAREAFAGETGAAATGDNREVANRAKILLLAVKPNQVPEALDSIRDVWTEDHLLISIAAGVPIYSLSNELGNNARIIRVMPNTPALVGKAACGFALGGYAKPEDAAIAQQLLSSVGVAFEVKEHLLDAVTGLSGSGPAYIYLVIEALSDGGVAVGLPRDVATELAAQTVLGAATMVLETGRHPGELKDMVTSPGGTTIEGVHQLENGRLRATLMNAVRAATERSRELGK